MKIISKIITATVLVTLVTSFGFAEGPSCTSIFSTVRYQVLSKIVGALVRGQSEILDLQKRNRVNLQLQLNGKVANAEPSESILFHIVTGNIVSGEKTYSGRLIGIETRPSLRLGQSDTSEVVMEIPITEIDANGKSQIQFLRKYIAIDQINGIYYPNEFPDHVDADVFKALTKVHRDKVVFIERSHIGETATRGFIIRPEPQSRTDQPARP